MKMNSGKKMDKMPKGKGKDADPKAKDMMGKMKMLMKAKKKK